MKRFKNILFVAETAARNDAALHTALELCRRNSAALTVAALVPDPIVASTPALHQALIDERREWLAGLVDAAEAGSVPIEIEILCGRAFVEIIVDVLRHGRDLVIKPAQRGMGVAGQIFAATDKKLLRKCPCPVWLIKSTERRGANEVLVAVDYEPDNAENEPLNRQLLDMAISLCVAEFAELHILHAWHLEHEGILRSPRMGLSREDVDRMVEQEEARRRSGLAKLIDERCEAQGDEVSEFLKPSLHLIQGPAHDVVPDYAEKMGAELVIMGTVARTGVPGLLIGNTAEAILNHLDCSILAVKPAGFVSPVTVGT